jgi:hypothetical protein
VSNSRVLRFVALLSSLTLAVSLRG